MDSSKEREEIEQYLGEHGVEAHLNRVVNDIVRVRPADPFVSLSAQLLPLSKSANTVLSVSAQEILSASASPALEVTVETIQGFFKGCCSIGPFDGDLDRFGGRGLRKSVDSVHHLIREKLVGRKLDLPEIDALLIQEPNVPDNVILAVSMACFRAAAKAAGVELYQLIADVAGIPDPCVPMPIFSLLNGGDLASSPLSFQVFRPRPNTCRPVVHLSNL
jgi:enolase